MQGKKALFALMLFILIVDMFWNIAFRTIAMRFPNSPWAKGLLYAK